MSYCRWSDESDVYSYSNGDTWTTHLTDGRSFHDSSLVEFKAQLQQLRTEGLRVPNDVFERIEGELAGKIY
jgi:hypothetical protein